MTGNEDGQHQGPIVPPRLGEIYEISARRQRTRYRVIQGTLAAVAVAGIGVGVRANGTDQSSDAAGVEESARTTSVPPAAMTDVTELERCFFTTNGEEMADWMVDGRTAYLTEPSTSVTELETLAQSWQIPFDEVKALVGFATGNGVALEFESIDEALVAWGEEGFTGEELAELANAWNVSTISIKVLRLIGSPEIDAALTECGLSTGE